MSQDKKKLSRRLMHSISKRLLVLMFTDVDGRQTPKEDNFYVIRRSG